MKLKSHCLLFILLLANCCTLEACCHLEGKESCDVSVIEDKVAWLVHSKSQLKGCFPQHISFYMTGLL